MHVSMLLLSYLIKKFEYIRPLLHDLREMLYYAKEQAAEEYVEEISNKQADDKRQSLANIQIYLKNLKEISNSLLLKLEGKTNKKQRNLDDSDSDDPNDPFLKNFRDPNNDTAEAKEKKKKEEEFMKQEESLRRKMEMFLILWLRQIVIYNTHYVLYLAYANGNMSNIIDVRPSIVKAASIKYALVSLMNPRLQAFQQVNNFKSMKRILDKIVTHFFKTFISTKEKSMIIDEIQKVRNNMIKIESLKTLDFVKFFEGNEEFKKF